MAQFTDIEVSVNLPLQLDYIAHTAWPGTSFIDGSGDEIPDRWLVPLLKTGDQFVLQVTARGVQLPATVITTTTAEITSWVGDDSDPNNNTDSIDVELRPKPELTVNRFVDKAYLDPGEIVTHSIAVTNTGGEDAKNVYMTETIEKFTDFVPNGFAGNPFEFEDSPLNPSGLSISDLFYSNDGISFLPMPGPPGWEQTMTHWQIELDGTFSIGGQFVLRYQARVK